MNKILQATQRGQITLPKSWRDKFDTLYYVAQIDSDEIVLRPMKQDSFAADVEKAWLEYENGEFISERDMIKKYGL